MANPNGPAGVLMQPPWMSLADNVEQAKNWSGVTANMHMSNNFRHGGAMDYQRTFGVNGKINADYIDIGNYNFGAVAAAAGYNLDEAQMGAGVANWFGSGEKSGDYGGNPRNQVMIAKGWRDYLHARMGR